MFFHIFTQFSFIFPSEYKLSQKKTCKPHLLALDELIFLDDPMKEQRESYTALSQEEKEDVENSIIGDSEDTAGAGNSQNQIFN